MIFEYKTLSLPSSAERQDMLSEMGLNGWELVGFEQGLAYFKRLQPVVIGGGQPILEDIRPSRFFEIWPVRSAI
jgi:hypothetical protein